MPNLLKLASDMYSILNDVYDSFVSGIKQIDTDHHYIHRQKKFRSFIEYQSVASTATYSVCFKTPKTTIGKEIHFRPPLVDCSGDKLRILLYRGTTAVGSTSLESYNYDDNSTISTTMQHIKKGVNRNSTGTLINPSFIGGGSAVGGKSSGGSSPQKEEIILRPDTEYTIDFTNSSSETNYFTAVFPWYEEITR